MLTQLHAYGDRDVGVDTSWSRHAGHLCGAELFQSYLSVHSYASSVI